jgi:carbamoylphosphate synthase small subunit
MSQLREIRNFYLPIKDPSVITMFKNRNWTHVNELKRADLVVLVGGRDINPKLYNQPKHTLTDTPDKDMDEIDTNAVNQALDLKIPVCGICRGAQLLHVLAGGYLYQNVNHHRSSHIAKYDDKEIYVNSHHHQMMADPTVGDVLMSTSIADKKEYYDEKGQLVEQKKGTDIEAMFYPKEKWLSYQPHPEWSEKTTEHVFFDMLENLYNE